MSSRKDKKRTQAANRPATPAVSAPPPSYQAQDAPISPAQANDIAALGEAAQKLPVEPSEAVPPQPGLTVAQAINEARLAQRRFEGAHRAAEQEKQTAHEELQSLKKQREEADLTLKKQQEELAAQRSDVNRRSEELAARERTLTEREERVMAREIEADAGFVQQRTSALMKLEAERDALRATLDQLAADAAARRSEEEAAWRRLADERAARWSREEAERSARWQREDAEHVRKMEEDRQRAEAERERAWAEYRARILADEQVIAGERAALEADRKTLRADRNGVAMERELLEEDQKALEDKVRRLASRQVADLEEALRAEQGRQARAAAQRDSYYQRLEAYQELERRFGGESPEQLLDRVQQLERERDELRRKLGERLGEASAVRLAELEKKQSDWLDERSVLDAKLHDAEARVGRLRVACVEVEQLRDHREKLEASVALLQGRLRELRVEVDSFTKAEETRNAMTALVDLDQDAKLHVEVPTRPRPGEPAPTLASLAVELRHRIATALPDRRLYYSARDVRCFLGGLAMSRLVLLQGISGTGKTSLPLAVAAAIGADCEVVAVQAGWRDRQDLVGYYNAFHRQYHTTSFLQALYRAGTPKCKGRPFLIVLDEINLSRVEQFFADFLSALEQPEHDRSLTLLAERLPNAPALLVEGRHLPIPPNVWFVGTANHDETTTEFADKTYDRAHVMELPRRDLERDFFAIEDQVPRDPLSVQWMTGAFSAARERRWGEIQEAQAWLRAKDGVARDLDRLFRVGWGNRLERDVENFVPVVVEAGGDVGEALDHLFATKVLRKLRDRHDVGVRGLGVIRDKLEKSWIGGASRPERSLNLLEREARAKQYEEATP
jgi:hypothetical protein